MSCEKPSFGALISMWIVCLPLDNGGSAAQNPSAAAGYEPARSAAPNKLFFGTVTVNRPGGDSARTIRLLLTTFPSTVTLMLNSGSASILFVNFLASRCANFAVSSGSVLIHMLLKTGKNSCVPTGTVQVRTTGPAL